MRKNIIKMFEWRCWFHFYVYTHQICGRSKQEQTNPRSIEISSVYQRTLTRLLAVLISSLTALLVTAALIVTNIFFSSNSFKLYLQNRSQNSQVSKNGKDYSKDEAQEQENTRCQAEVSISEYLLKDLHVWCNLKRTSQLSKQNVRQYSCFGA